MHKVFGKKEEAEYTDRQGAYLIPVKDGKVGVVRTGKGYFLLGGGLNEGEDDEAGLRRECMEETGYRVSVGRKIGSAETYCKVPGIGYFHPVQTYYMGELLEQIQERVEKDHVLVWIEFGELRGNMHLEMQNWAIEEGWNKLEN